MKLIVPLCATATGLCGLVPTTAWAADAQTHTQSDQDSAIEWLFQTRTRYQTTQKDKLEDAESLTHRTQAGFKLPLAQSGLTLLAEWENSITILGDDRNTSEDPKPQFATINDPEHSELNRLNLAYAATENLSFKLGRQYIAFDNNRFVASANWRQDRGSHDALRIDVSNGPLQASYAYHWQINRPAGTNNDWRTDTHLFHASYEASDQFKLTGFTYLIDILDPLEGDRSNMTLGSRLTANHKVNDDFKLYVDAMIANQTDYGSSSLDYDLNFFAGSLTAKFGDFKALIGYDYIEGNGTNSIQTPFAALKSFTGAANVINAGQRAAPPDGAKALTLGTGFTHDFDAGGIVEGIDVSVYYLDFEAENTGIDLGSEWDASIKLDLTNNFSMELGYADYNSASGSSGLKDTSKTWFILSYKY